MVEDELFVVQGTIWFLDVDVEVVIVYLYLVAWGCSLYSFLGETPFLVTLA
jgi:hypothetical protein